MMHLRSFAPWVDGQPGRLIVQVIFLPSPLPAEGEADELEVCHPRLHMGTFGKTSAGKDISFLRPLFVYGTGLA